MLRRLLVAASQSEGLRRLATDVPVTRNVALRFVAGETLVDALEVTGALNQRGMRVTLDYLGESVHDADIARRAAAVYLDALDRVERDGLRCSISVKLTQVGLDVSEDLCRDLVSSICRRAAAGGRHVTIDMEASAYTQRTVDLVTDLRKAGHDNVGCAVQSYLRRTASDVAALSDLHASLRLCKGAYAEPDDVAFPSDREVDASYARLAEQLLRSDTYPRFATHDHRLIHHVRNVAARLQRPADSYEFQMLYGVREPLQQRIVEAGHALRIYVPFGGEWYPYLVRRLAERPANLTFFLRALLGRRTG